MLLEAWMVKFYTTTYQFFWSENGLTVSSEKWDDGFTANEDGFRGHDWEHLIII